MYIIYCDMDGVLVDFEKGYYDLTGTSTKQFPKGDNSFWQPISAAGAEFWANLPWMPDGQELWRYIKKYKPSLLTAPSVNMDLPYELRYKLEHNECMQGKNIWIEQLDNRSKIYFKSAKHKSDLATSNSILIDDREDTIYDWNRKGGIGILHTSTNETINQLSILGL